MTVIKYVVVDEPLSEAEVHPPESYRRLVELSVAAAAQLETRPAEGCPACGESAAEAAFSRHGFEYTRCRLCATLYADPRPDATGLAWYLHESDAARYRRRDDYRAPLERHAREVAHLRADWVQEILRAHGCREGAVVDFQTRSSAFLEALVVQRLAPVLAVDPLLELSDRLRENGVGRRGALADLAEASCRIVTAFDVLEHVAEPRALAAEAYRALAPGGLLTLTARSASGLDIQVLWGDCPTLFPADHLNLLTVEGIRALLEGAGFEILEISTPGQLDVELVERTLAENPAIDVPRFLRYLFEHRGRDTKARLQQFLQQHLLSSHLRVIARKRGQANSREER